MKKKMMQETKKVIAVKNGQITIGFPSGIISVLNMGRKMMQIVKKDLKLMKKYPAKEREIEERMNKKLATEFEKVFGKGACKKVYGIDNPTFPYHEKFIRQIDSLFDEWMR